MKKLLTAFSCVIVSASLLLSCSSSSSSSSSSPAAKRFETVLEMRDAFIGAGGDCPNWQISTVKLALSSGTCSDTDVLSVYSSRAVAEEQNSVLKKVITETFPDSLNDTLTLLVGENWILNDSDLETLFKFQDLYGGDYITSYTQIP